MSAGFIMPAEWFPQAALQITWPHPRTDWAPRLPEVMEVFTRIAVETSRHEDVLVVCHNSQVLADCRRRLEKDGADMVRCHLYVVPSNDSWTRDFGPITIRHPDGRRKLVDFGFNAWGLKFPADLDNQVTRRLHALGAYGNLPLEIQGMILEGGSIDSDGSGTLLTTSTCLLSPNRNPQWSREEITQHLCELLGAERIFWLQSGYLEGDDTDAHIDTLARFCSTGTIAYQSCDDPMDTHFAALQQMAAELASFPREDGQPYHLIPLPWPQARFDGSGNRLPLSYANFLILNHAILLPGYEDPMDAVAAERLAEAFPGREITVVPCLELAHQHGSLHCVTMQIPA